MWLEDRSRNVYKAPVYQEENSTFEQAKIPLAKTTEFKTLTFRLKYLRDLDNNLITDVNNILENIINLQFTIIDNEEGTLYLDNIMFGMIDESESPTNQFGPIPDSGISISYKDKRIFISSESTDPIRNVDILDMQGNYLYRMSDMESSYISLNSRKENRPVIIKVRTTKDIKTEKIILK